MAEGNFGSTAEEVDGFLHGQLEEIFALAPAAEADSILKTDLCLDVYIPAYLTGYAEMLDFGSFAIPLIWRPKVELMARLFRLHDGKRIKTFRVKQRLSFRECISTYAPTRAGPASEAPQLAYLLNKAAMQLLQKVAKVAYR